MNQSEVERLDSLMSKINVQLTELGELLADVSKWPDGSRKRQFLDRISQNQDALFTRADGIRASLRRLGLNMPERL